MLFFAVAILYSSVGFGGGSSYLAILALSGIVYTQIRATALLCNIIVVLGNVLLFHHEKKLNWKKSPISGNSYWRADCNMNAVRQYFHHKISGYNEQAYYYGQMLKTNLITKEYYDQNVQGFDKTDSILEIIKSTGISDKAVKKYENFLVEKKE